MNDQIVEVGTELYNQEKNDHGTVVEYSKHTGNAMVRTDDGLVRWSMLVCEIIPAE